MVGKEETRLTVTSMSPIEDESVDAPIFPVV